ncbi:SMI1/KNR4 family protein [Aeoliella sp.]|uniref:SMI1/KNR4 family protein n=1 Tax=Aeoliella sp. TaxID=2795800 RepID=UPI003CCBCAB7
MSEFRRFFFDDGDSRKRWQVQVKGTSQVVKYGRLTGSLRETKKKFKSAAEAKENSAKLIAAKIRGGYTEIDPLRLEIERSKGVRGATEKQVAALEKKIGCKLPEEYRQFLMQRNGGLPNPFCVKIPGIEYIDNVGVGEFFHLKPSKPAWNELTQQIDRCVGVVPKGYLPVASEGDLFTLSLKPKTFGAIHWWNHETDEGDDDGNYYESAAYLLAGSFDEFLTRVATFLGDEAEEFESAEEASEASVSGKKPKASVKGLFRLMQHEHTPEKIEEIERVVKELGDLSQIEDRQWPFTNISSVRVLRPLLKAGLNPEITDTESQTLLWQCASSAPCINLLVKQGVDIERRSGSESETPLMRAIFLESIPAVKRLIELGANPTVRLKYYISSKITYNKRLGKIVEDARVKWRRKAARKKKAKKN